MLPLNKSASPTAVCLFTTGMKFVWVTGPVSLVHPLPLPTPTDLHRSEEPDPLTIRSLGPVPREWLRTEYGFSHYAFSSSHATVWRGLVPGNEIPAQLYSRV